MTPLDRGLIFWTLCIPSRLYLAILARSNPRWLRIFASLVAYRWLNGLENSSTGWFGGHVWWAEERFFHGVLWGLYAVTGDAKLLEADVLFGMGNWILK